MCSGTPSLGQIAKIREHSAELGGDVPEQAEKWIPGKTCNQAHEKIRHLAGLVAAKRGITG